MKATDKVTAMVREDCLINGVSLDNAIDISMKRSSMPSRILVERYGDGKSETRVFAPEQHDEIKALRAEVERLRSCLDDADENARWILGENAKLRDELDQWHRLTAGIKLPDYPITEFHPKDLERENAKLRELVRDMACEYECGYLTLPQWLADRMRELGIEVK